MQPASLSSRHTFRPIFPNTQSGGPPPGSSRAPGLQPSHGHLDTRLDLAGGAGAVGECTVTCRTLLSGEEKVPPRLSQGLCGVGVERAICPNDRTQIFDLQCYLQMWFYQLSQNTLMGWRDWTLWPALKQVCSSLLISWCIFPADFPPPTPWAEWHGCHQPLKRGTTSSPPSHCRHSSHVHTSSLSVCGEPALARGLGVLPRADGSLVGS